MGLPADRRGRRLSPHDDPLDGGIEGLPLQTQVVLLANEMRHQRNAMYEMQRTNTWVLRTLVGLLVTVIGGLVLFILSTGGHP